MEDLSPGTSIGSRVREARKARGIKSTAELSSLIPGSGISGAVLRNIEAGVKTDLTISELLNIASALRIAPIYLLAPIREPDARLDLVNLSDDFENMTAIEFDEWLSGTSDAVNSWSTPEDHSERSQLRAMRELERQTRERNRLSMLLSNSAALGSQELLAEGDGPVEESTQLTLRRADTERNIDRLSRFLQSAGWDVRRWTR